MRNRKPQARFAYSSGSYEGKETHLWTVQERTNLCHFTLTTNQWCEGQGEVVCGVLLRTSHPPERKCTACMLHGQHTPESCSQEMK